MPNVYDRVFFVPLKSLLLLLFNAEHIIVCVIVPDKKLRTGLRTATGIAQTALQAVERKDGFGAADLIDVMGMVDSCTQIFVRDVQGGEGKPVARCDADTGTFVIGQFYPAHIATVAHGL